MAVKGKQELPAWNSDMINMERISTGRYLNLGIFGVV